MQTTNHLIPDLRPHTRLIEHLDAIFPLRNPLQGDSMESIRHTAGARSVVEYLLRNLEEQEESIELTAQGIL